MGQQPASRPERPERSDRTIHADGKRGGGRAIDAARVEAARTARLPAAVAHELANPLVAMTQAVSVLRASLSDPEDLALADCVLAEGRRLRRLVQRVAVAGWRPVRSLDPVAIEDLVHGVVALVRLDPRVPGDVRFHIQLAPDLTPVVMDPDAMTQVLWNLVLNATQAVERGGNVTVVAEEARGNRLRLEVRDDGPGLLCEPARALESGVSLRPGGSGLGLALSREIVEAHGGELSVASSQEGGARVRLWIPCNGPTH